LHIVSATQRSTLNRFSRLTSDGIVKGLLGEVAGLVGSVENLVVEDGEVQGEAETDGVGGGELGLGNLGGSLVGLEGLVGGVLAAVADGELGQVAVVVALPVVVFIRIGPTKGSCCARLHLVVEDLGLARLSGRNQVLVENLKNVLADLGELVLNLLAVLLDVDDVSRVTLGLLLLLDGGDDPPRGTAGTDDVLVGDGEKVALLDSEVAILASDDLHVVDHLWWRQRLAGSR
jgi:hypothetical protein